MLYLPGVYRGYDSAVFVWRISRYDSAVFARRISRYMIVLLFSGVYQGI